jgi:hypothetical protein
MKPASSQARLSHGFNAFATKTPTPKLDLNEEDFNPGYTQGWNNSHGTAGDASDHDHNFGNRSVSNHLNPPQV